MNSPIEPEDLQPEQNGQDAEPTVILPQPNAYSGVTGMLADGNVASPAILPPPLLESPDEADENGMLADRISSVLSDDGRFAPYVPHLTIVASDGQVQLGGPIAAAFHKSLVMTVYAIPGVTEVDDLLADLPA